MSGRCFIEYTITSRKWVVVYSIQHTDADVVNNLQNENMETFVLFKNGEDSNDFSRESSTLTWSKVVQYNH